ncbi:MAG: peptide deformylase [Solibacteraceae bacterium]|nr:peptide deformylase [Solibacteraceae bacterium]
MTLRIRKYGDPVLETNCTPVAQFGTDELKQLVEDMFETMYAHNGVGLAAPQVNSPQRLTVIDTSNGEARSRRRARADQRNPRKKRGKQVGEEVSIDQASARRGAGDAGAGARAGCERRVLRGRMARIAGANDSA